MPSATWHADPTQFIHATKHVSGGVNIYTKEIEAILFEHPAVLEAAVIGLPDEQWGEAVTAAVVLRPGMQATAAALVAHCRAHLASYKKPKHVIFVEELPKNPSGKVLKRDLRPQLTASLSIDHRTEEPRHG